MASSLVDTLTASGGAESAGEMPCTHGTTGCSSEAGFLNDIVAQLWPNICVAGAQMVKSTVEPILASTLPGPLANLKFVKLDLGQVPIRFSKVDVHKSATEGIKLDMDMEWESVCDVELDGARVPKIVRHLLLLVIYHRMLEANSSKGIEKAHLKGRLSILLCPLTNIIPLVKTLNQRHIGRKC